MSPNTMNSISSAFIVFVGAAFILHAPYVTHSDTRSFINFVGCLVGIIGMIGWVISFKDTRELIRNLIERDNNESN